MFSATHSLKGLSCLNSPGTPQRHSADLRRQQNFAEKSVIAAISCVEQRSFKIPQLPALREVVSESAQQKRRFFLLLIGGIDISIGSVVALTCMSSAQMLQNTGLPAPTVILIVLAMGAVFGLVQGWLIAEFNMQPFIVTLAGQFFARGMTAIISRETIVIDNPVYTSLASARIYVLPGGFISVGVVIALVTLVAATLVLKFTRFGRNIYALGGNEMSAQLMGLPTKRTKILAYVVCGFCSALAGVVYSLIMLSGYPLHAVSMEMDAIASSVIGGTLMSGGVAFLPGTLLGVLIQGVIQTFITFQGTLSAWWTRIIIALLLCLFIVIQAVVSRSRQRLNSEH